MKYVLNKRIDRKGDIMECLGMIMDSTGFTLPFGEMKEDNNHEYSFKKEVEPTNYFRDLNLTYDQESSFYQKAMSFAQQGIVSIFNTSIKDNGSVMIFSPSELTDEQKNIMKHFYEDLNNLDTCNIFTIKSDEDYNEYENVDSYYNDMNISLKTKILKK